MNILRGFAIIQAMDLVMAARKPWGSVTCTADSECTTAYPAGSGPVACCGTATPDLTMKINVAAGATEEEKNYAKAGATQKVCNNKLSKVLVIYAAKAIDDTKYTIVQADIDGGKDLPAAYSFQCLSDAVTTGSTGLLASATVTLSSLIYYMQN